MSKAKSIIDVFSGLKLMATSPQAHEMVKRFTKNYFTGRPFVASLVLTGACRADCDFCKYRRSNTQQRTKPVDSYAEALQPLNLPFLSIVGGEPLIRKDLPRLIQEAKQENGIPYVHVVTNGGLLTAMRYSELEEAGLDELVISLDFASGAHSAERGIEGLYERIAAVLPKLKGKTRVRLNAILMRDNLVKGEYPAEDVRGVVEFANKHGVQVSFGAYSAHRNNNDAHMPKPEDWESLERTLKYLLLAQAEGTVSSTAEYLSAAASFLKGNEIPNCQAGKRFLWITADGKYMPCNDYPKFTYSTHEEARAFPVARTCTACYAECRGLPEQIASSNLLKIAMTGASLAQTFSHSRETEPVRNQ